MYVFLYVHVCNYISICMCVRIHVCDPAPHWAIQGVSLNSQRFALLPMYICNIRIDIYMFIYTHICIDTYIYICKCVCIHVFDSTPQSAIPGVSLNSQQFALLPMYICNIRINVNIFI